MGQIKTTRFDIGAEVLSILTRGMYPDPKDALREYIQNGVDAGAKSVQIRVRKNTITITDDGKGMDVNILRKAARVGVSEKNPGKDVGFMGIGIYSAFHLCDELSIYSRTEKDPACFLSMDFKGMKIYLDDQKEKRLNNEISSDELLDLQSLLERYIIMDEIGDNEYPDFGTRVEIIGLNPEFTEEFSNFKKLTSYLREVIPLEFDKINFKWSELIEKKIGEICQRHDAKFELVKLFLQVNNQSEWLFRAYSDTEFNNSESYEPIFEELTTNDQFYGVIWGSLNYSRNKIQNKDLRGFLIKKQGFAIGDRQKLSSYMRQVYYDRYLGEVIIVNPKVLPNAARNDFAYSKNRTILYELMAKAFETFNLKAHEVQEYTLGDEQLDENTEKLKNINENFSLYTKDPDKLINYVVEIRQIKKQIEDRKDRGSIRQERIKDATKFIHAATELGSAIESTIKVLSEETKKITQKQKEAPNKVSKDLATIKPSNTSRIVYSSLTSLIESLDIVIPDDVKSILNIIDERVLQSLASNEKHYIEILSELKEEFEKLT